MEERVTPDAEYVLLGNDLMFYGEVVKTANPSGGFDYTFDEGADLGWAPPAGTAPSPTTFAPLYSYASGVIVFNDSGFAPEGVPNPPAPPATGTLAFLIEGGVLSTVPVTDGDGTTFGPYVAASGVTEYVNVDTFVNDGLSLAAPLKLDFGQYFHVVIDSLGFGAPPVLDETYTPELALRGEIIIGSTETGGKNINLAINGTSYIGLSSNGIDVTGFSATVSGSFDLAGITITVNGAGIGYSAAAGDTPPQLSISGTATAAFGTPGDMTTVTANLFDTNNPGIVFNLGSTPGLERVHFQATGKSDLDGVKIEFDALDFLYQAGTDGTGDEYQVGGGIEIIFTNQLSVAVSLGTPSQPGLTIANGTWILDGFSIFVANVSLPGGWGLTKLSFAFATDTTNGGYDISGDVEVKVPAGFSIGGGLGFVDGELASVQIDYDVSEGEGFLRVPGTGLYISSLHGSLQNLNQLSDLVISAAVSVAYGPSFTFPDRTTTYEIARGNLSGTFSTSEIVLSGGVYFLAQETQPAPGAGGASDPNSPDYSPEDSGYDADDESDVQVPTQQQQMDKLPQFKGVIGSGSATVNINLAQSSGTVTANASFVDGLIRANFLFTIDDELDIYTTGSAGAYFPNSIPLIGGTELAGVGFEFKWDGDAHTGYIAAATDILGSEIGFSYTIQSYTGNSNDFSIIYSGPFNGAFSGTTTYTITVDPSSLLDGATDALYTVDYGNGGLFDAMSVTDPNGNTYNYGNGSFGTDLIQVQPNPPEGQFAFSFAASTSNVYTPLLAGNYTITLTTKSALSSQPSLAANATIAAPTVAFDSSFGATGTPQTSGGLLTVPIVAQAGFAVQSTTTVTLYADTDGTGYDGVPIGTATMPAGDASNPGALTSVNVNGDFRGLLPISYKLYAIIDDGTNPLVYSPYSSFVEADQLIFGQVLSSQTNLGIPGLFLWIDTNDNGMYDPPTQDPTTGTVTIIDPGAWTNGTDGSYSFPRAGGTGELPLTAGDPYTLYLDLPTGFTFVSSTASGASVVPATPNQPVRVSVPFTYNPGVSFDFTVSQAPTITGTVTTVSQTETGTPITVGLSGVVVYADLNGNGQFDRGTEPAGVTDKDGQYRIIPLTAGDQYTLRLYLASNEQVTSGTPDSVSVTVSADASNGTSNPIATAAAFQVTRLSVISGNISGYALSNNYLSGTATDLSDWTVQLLDMSGNILQTTTTDTNGNYSFLPVAPNVQYTVQQNPPANTGWRQIMPQGTSAQFTFTSLGANEGLSYLSVAHGDFNGDGVTDYATVALNSKSIYVFLSGTSNGTPNYTLETISNVSPGDDSAEDHLFKISVGDFFGDGSISLFAIDRSNYVYVLQYDSTQSSRFSPWGRLNFKDVPSGTAPMDFVVADYDGDGHDDFAFSAQGVNATQNDPYIIIQTYTDATAQIDVTDGGTHGFKGSETWFEYSLPDNGAGGLAAGYLNGPTDPRAALVVNALTDSNDGYSGGAFFELTINNGPGTQAVGGTDSYSPGQFGLGYLDNDMYLDGVFAYPGLGSSTPTFAILRTVVLYGQTVTGTVPVTGGPSSLYSIPVTLVDLNLDGLADMAYAPSAYDPAHNEVQDSPSSDSPLVIYLNQIGYGQSISTVPFSTTASQSFSMSTYNSSTSDPAQITEVRPGLLSGYPSLTAGSALSNDAYPDLTIAMVNAGVFLVGYNTTNPTPNQLIVTAPATSDLTGVSFQNAQIRSLPESNVLAVSPINTLGGIVYHDVNRNGAYEPADKPRAGIELYLDLNGNGSPDTHEPRTATNQFGAYAFGNLANGTYTVRPVREADRKITTPDGDGVTVSLVNGSGGRDADFGSIVSKDLVVQARSTTQGGNWLVTRYGGSIRVFDQTTNTLLLSELLSEVNSLQIVGATAADDTLTVDYGGGRFMLPGGIRFDAGANPGDNLSFRDRSIPNDITLTPDSANIDGLKLSWGGTMAVSIATADAEDTVRVVLPPGQFATAKTESGVTTVEGLPYRLTLTGVDHLIIPEAPVVPPVIQPIVPPVVPPTVILPGVVAAAGDGSSRVIVYGQDGSVLRSFFAYESEFTGGVNVAVGDVTGDGVADIVTAAGPGGGPRVRVFDGQTGDVVRDFYAFDETFAGGVSVAVGDITGDGLADIVTGAGPGGGPRVTAFDSRTGAEVMSFYAYDASFSGGVNVAVGDVNDDGVLDIITGAGVGGAPHVKAFDGRTFTELLSFYAYDVDLRGGVFVSVGDLDGDGQNEIVAGAGAVGPTQVRVFAPDTGALEFSFGSESIISQGTRVVARDVTDDGRVDVVTGTGPGVAPTVTSWTHSADRFDPLFSFDPFDPLFLGGVFVG